MHALSMALVLALAVLLPLPSLSLPLPFHASRSRAKQLPKAPPSANPLRLLATTTPEDSSDSPPLQDFSTAAAGIFNSYRIPSLAAAAAAYGGVYALPLTPSRHLVGCDEEADRCAYVPGAPLLPPTSCSFTSGPPAA
mmetsp:Transcript_26716/g.59931  ORF Transcript_26716/g.59931 Transcript_26716/m.59931 type:complete len:138 (+) Transcript_26716:165-578(+)